MNTGKENKTDDILEKLVHINRITKVVKGGRRFGFSALVVVGNQAGRIGIAHAKAKQVPDAIKKANEMAKHKIIPLKKINKITNKTYDFVGPICETTDKFLSTTKFQKLNEKDYIIICDVGAYGTSLSSNYNIRPKPAEILIKGSRINVIKKRQKLKDLI